MENQKKYQSFPTDVRKKLWFTGIPSYRGHGATVWWINPLTTYINAATDHLWSLNRESSARNKIFSVDNHNYAGARASEMKCRRASRLMAWRLGQLLVHLWPDKDGGGARRVWNGFNEVARSRNERQTEVSGLFNKRSAGVRSVGRKGLSFSLPRRPRHYGDEHQQSSHSETQLTAG